MLDCLMPFQYHVRIGLAKTNFMISPSAHSLPTQAFSDSSLFLVCTTHFFARIRLRSNGRLDPFCPWYKNRGVEQKKHSFYLWWKRSFKPSLLCLVSFCTATLLISPFCTTDSYKFSCVLLPIQNNILKKLFFKTLVHSTLLLIWEDFFWASIGSF